MKEITVLEIDRQYKAIICSESHCIFKKSCANHSTTGDFRSEDGLKPKLHYENGRLMCSTIDCEIDEQYPYSIPFPIDEHDRGEVLWKEVKEKTDAYEI